MVDAGTSAPKIPGGGFVADVPEELRLLPRWVAWRSVVKDRESGKRTKIPISPVTGKGADCTKPEQWGTFAQALDLCETDNCDGVSFALGDGFVGVDLDDVIDPDTGEIDPDAAATVDRFGSYAELSPSRTGIHILLKGTLAHLTGRKRGDRECYDSKRFLTVTGLRGSTFDVEERQAVLDQWHSEVFPLRPGPNTYTGPARPLDLSDSDILARIARSKQSIKFGRLWAGNTDGYPSGSEADLALCSILAFWCQCRPDVVDRIFRSSGLMRPKWDRLRSGIPYNQRTVTKAVTTTPSYDPEYNRTDRLAQTSDYTRDNSAPAPASEPASTVSGTAGGLPISYYADAVASLDAADFVEGLLIDGTMSVVYGESNCGKTFFVLDLALHVAAGLEWRGRAVERRGVLYLALEGAFGIRNRVAAFKAAHPELTDLPFAFVPVSLSLLGPESDTLRVVEAAKEAAARLTLSVGLIVVDTLSRAMGGGNENSPEDMGEFVRNVDVIRQALPAHTAVVHHSGKDTAKGARGHSSLRAATDTEIEVTRDLTTKVSVARVTKQRDLELGAEFPFRLEPVVLGQDRRKKPVTSCVVRAMAPVASQPGAAKPVPQRPTAEEQARAEDAAVLLAIDRETVSQVGATITRIRDITSFSNDRAKKVIQRLLSSGAIENVQWKKGVGNGAAQGAEGWRRPG